MENEKKVKIIYYGLCQKCKKVKNLIVDGKKVKKCLECR